MEVLYQDNRVLVVVKPIGIRSTDEPGGLPALVRDWLGDPKACVRTVHRLDQVTGGAMVLARSRKAAQLLSQQVREGQFRKEYLAVVHGDPPEAGTLRDLLVRDRARRMTLVAHCPGPDVKEAILDYRVLERRAGLSLLAVRLHTGRTHQIRVQFASRGWPLAGDKKYGGEENGPLGLWSRQVSFLHPQSGARLTCTAPAPPWEPWTLFSTETEP